LKITQTFYIFIGAVVGKLLLGRRIFTSVASIRVEIAL